MGWGNGQVEYGAAPIYGGVVYEDTRAIEFLQKENQKLIKLFEETFVNSRAWTLVAYTLANSKNREHRSKEELNALHKKAKGILLEYVKKHGFLEFNKNVPPAISLEP